MHDADDGLHICDGGGCEEGLAVGMLQECAALLFEAVECRWIVRVVVESWGIDGAVARSSRTEMEPRPRRPKRLQINLLHDTHTPLRHKTPILVRIQKEDQI